jgi:hypothetical protein
MNRKDEEEINFDLFRLASEDRGILFVQYAGNYQADCRELKPTGP